VLDLARARLGGGVVLDVAEAEPLKPTLIQVVDELVSIQPDRIVETHFDFEDPVKCDRVRIGQLLSNLLGNALMHGAEDSPVRIRASIDGDDFELSVSNSGEPIPLEAQEQLFLPFFRREARPGQQGLGLGLYIASEIARVHGGTLEVASTADETRFTFRMPLVR
jgi:signal transduction histidine kinase